MSFGAMPDAAAHAMPPTGEIPPRIHVLLASESPVAIILRRGPSRMTAVLAWDRSRDTLTLGQWLKGRIYERRSDVSPDGRHLIYFALNGRWHQSAGGSWTAISRAPYLKALSLFSKGDAWHGGGLFKGPGTYWLNDGNGHRVVHDTAPLTRDLSSPFPDFVSGECPGVYFKRLLRDGWTLASRELDRQAPRSRDTFEKRFGDHWILRKHAHGTLELRPGRGLYYDTHELLDTRTGNVDTHDDWEWAEVDGRRLVWAAHGCIRAAIPGPGGAMHEQTLFDLAPMTFEPIVAPY